MSSLRLHSTYEEGRLRAGTPSTVQRALRSSLCGCCVLRGPGGSRTPTARGGCFTGSWSQPHDQCRPRAERLAPLRNSWMPIQLSKVQVHRLMLTRRSPTDEAPDVGIEPTPCSFGGCLVAMTCPTCGTTRERCLVALLLVSSPLASDLRGTTSGRAWAGLPDSQVRPWCAHHTAATRTGHSPGSWRRRWCATSRCDHTPVEADVNVFSALRISTLTTGLADLTAAPSILVGGSGAMLDQVSRDDRSRQEHLSARTSCLVVQVALVIPPSINWLPIHHDE